MLFDVHSLAQINYFLSEQMFAETSDEIVYIWTIFEGDEPDGVEHELTFFFKDERTEMYERFEEVHYQRTYSIATYTNLLKKAGFDVEAVLANFNEEVTDTSQRIFFVAKKQEK